MDVNTYTRDHPTIQFDISIKLSATHSSGLSIARARKRQKHDMIFLQYIQFYIIY